MKHETVEEESGAILSAKTFKNLIGLVLFFAVDRLS